MSIRCYLALPLAYIVLFLISIVDLITGKEDAYQDDE